MNSGIVGLPGGVVPPAASSDSRLQERDVVLGFTENESPVPALFRAIARRYGFRIGSTALLIKQNTRSESVPAPVIATLPHSPRWLLGLINLRGNLVPVFDLKYLFGIEHAAREGQDGVLVLDTGEKAVGFPIDALPTPVSNLAQRDHLPELPEHLSGSVSACYDTGSDIWIEFDHEVFFSSLKQNMASAETSEPRAASDSAMNADPV